MACKQCQKNRERAMAKARQLRDAKVDRLTKGCEAGNEGACMTLRSLLLSESYREQTATAQSCIDGRSCFTTAFATARGADNPIIAVMPTVLRGT